MLLLVVSLLLASTLAVHLATDIRLAPLAQAASRVERSEGAVPVDGDALLHIAETVPGCTDYDRAAGTLALVALDRAQGIDGGRARADAAVAEGQFRKILRCWPMEANAWLRMAMLRGEHSRDRAGSLGMLAMAQRLDGAGLAAVSNRLGYAVMHPDETALELARADVATLAAHATPRQLRDFCASLSAGALVRLRVISGVLPAGAAQNPTDPSIC